MVVKPEEPSYEILPYNEKLSHFSDLTEVQKLPPINISLTPEEILLTREFLGAMFPKYIHDVELDDMNYILCVCSAFRKMSDALKALDLDIDEFDDI